jgi:hypothetical protein
MASHRIRREGIHTKHAHDCVCVCVYVCVCACGMDSSSYTHKCVHTQVLTPPPFSARSRSRVLSQHPTLDTTNQLVLRHTWLQVECVPLF